MRRPGPDSIGKRHPGPLASVVRMQRLAGNLVTRRVLDPFVQRQAGPLSPETDRPDASRLNLESPRFAGDPVLEAVFDDRHLLLRGHRGEPVRKVQQALIDAGFPLPKFGADAVFGQETEDAVKAFQRAVGLEDAQIDGIVGPLTLSRLDARFTEGSAVVPERRCELGVRSINVDGAVFHGFTDSPQSFIADANRVFLPCCIQFVMGATVSISEARTRALLDGGTTLFHGPCGAMSLQERRIAADPVIGAFSKPFKILFAERLEGPNGRLGGFAPGTPSCARLGSAPLRGFFSIAQGADLRVMSHEFAHYLMDVHDEHRVQASNVQHISRGATGEEVTPVQCDIMYTRALDESI